MKHWLVATYKINEVKRLESNLLNQSIDYYLPKIITKKYNCSPKEEAMFPGYIFINTDNATNNYSSVKYTKGIKKIIKFGKNIPYISDEDIKSINSLEKSSRIEPLAQEVQIGQEVTIVNGCFKGNVAKICSLPTKKRVGILLFILGSLKKIDISKNDLIY